MLGTRSHTQTPPAKRYCRVTARGPLPIESYLPTPWAPEAEAPGSPRSITPLPWKRGAVALRRNMVHTPGHCWSDNPFNHHLLCRGEESESRGNHDALGLQLRTKVLRCICLRQQCKEVLGQGHDGDGGRVEHAKMLVQTPGPSWCDPNPDIM